MTVEHVEVLVEEASMEAALRLLLPKMLGDGITFQVYPSNGKRDLLDNLSDRLRGYQAWLPETRRIVVVVDRDDEDCNGLKQRLERMAHEAGLTTKASARGALWQVVNRLAIEELEAWFFGDPDAVRAVYPGVPDTLEQRAGFRDPDAIRGGTWEALERVLQRAGHFAGGYRKLEAAREIAAHMDPQRNRSHSFGVFRDTMFALGGGCYDL
jgi:hypothetical protein